MAISLRSFFGKAGSNKAGAADPNPATPAPTGSSAPPTPQAPPANAGLLFKTAAPETLGQPVGGMPSPFAPAGAAPSGGLTIGDLLPSLPPDVAKNPGLPANHPVSVPEAVIEAALRNGRAALPLFEVFRACPALFQFPVSPHDPREVALPPQKIASLLPGRAAPGNAAPAPAASPFAMPSPFQSPPAQAPVEEDTKLFQPSPFSQPMEAQDSPFAAPKNPVSSAGADRAFSASPFSMPAAPAESAPPSPFMSASATTVSSPFSIAAPLVPEAPNPMPPGLGDPVGIPPMPAMFGLGNEASLQAPAPSLGAPPPLPDSLGSPFAAQPPAPQPQPFAAFSPETPQPAPQSPAFGSPFATFTQPGVPEAPAPAAEPSKPPAEAATSWQAFFANATPPPAMPETPASAPAAPFFSEQRPQQNPATPPPAFGAPAGFGSPFELTPPIQPQPFTPSSGPVSPFEGMEAPSAPPAPAPASFGQAPAAPPSFSFPPAPQTEAINPFARIEALRQAQDVAKPAPEPAAPTNVFAGVPPTAFAAPVALPQDPIFAPVPPSAAEETGGVKFSLASALKNCAPHDLGTGPENIPPSVQFTVPQSVVNEQLGTGRLVVPIETVISGLEPEHRALLNKARPGLQIELPNNDLFHAVAAAQTPAPAPAASPLPFASPPKMDFAPQPDPFAAPALAPQPDAEPEKFLPQPPAFGSAPWSGLVIGDGAGMPSNLFSTKEPAQAASPLEAQTPEPVAQQIPSSPFSTGFAEEPPKQPTVVIPANSVTGFDAFETPAPTPEPARGAGAAFVASKADNETRRLLLAVVLGSPDVADVASLVGAARKLPGVSAVFCVNNGRVIAQAGDDSAEATRFLRDAPSKLNGLSALAALTGIPEAETLHIQTGESEATFSLQGPVTLAVLHDPRRRETVLKEKITLLGREVAAMLSEHTAG